MWNNNRFNPYTGEEYKTRDIQNIIPKHNKGVFLEDFGHNWNIHNNKLDYFSRIRPRNIDIDILIQYEEL